MRKILVLVSLLIPLSGCSLLGGVSDYDSHVKGRVEFKQSDDLRVASQAASIAEIAAAPTQTAEGAAFQKALGMVSIALIKNQDYGEAPPMTWTQVAGKAVDTVPFLAGMGGMYMLGKEALSAAGNVEIGSGATVSGSLNKHQASSLGYGTAAVQPYEVRPEVVNPVIVPGVQ